MTQLPPAAAGLALIFNLSLSPSFLFFLSIPQLLLPLPTLVQFHSESITSSFQLAVSRARGKLLVFWLQTWVGEVVAYKVSVPK